MYISRTTAKRYTKKDLEDLADLGIFPSSLGVFTKADMVDEDLEIDLMLEKLNINPLNFN